MGKVYIHLFTWPGAKLELTGVKGKVAKAYLLADPRRPTLKIAQDGEKLTVNLPEKPAGSLATVLCLEVE